tara:strand:+ start:28696 stop:29400 length:705 start_codon:yes stop_codon:yes gene_type:complete
MSFLGVDTFGSPINNLVLNANTQESREGQFISMIQPNMAMSNYHGFTDVEDENTEGSQITHSVNAGNWWGGDSQIANRPEQATDVGSVTILDNRGLERDWDIDEETGAETQSTTHWYDWNTDSSITNEEAQASIASLSNRAGARNLQEFDEDGDGNIDSYSWTQDVQRTFWNFLDRPSRNTNSATDSSRNFLPQQLPNQRPRTNFDLMPKLPSTQQEKTTFSERISAAWRALFR